MLMSPVIDFYLGGCKMSSIWRMCRSNFELGDLNFFRSEAYMRYFNYLDR